jgi:hypothetical protein
MLVLMEAAREGRVRPVGVGVPGSRMGIGAVRPAGVGVSRSRMGMEPYALSEWACAARMGGVLVRGLVGS